MKMFKALIMLCMMVLLTDRSFAESEFTFKGDFDLTGQAINIVVDIEDQRSVAATFRRVADNGYKLSLDINHLKTPLFDLLSKIESDIELKQNDGNSSLPATDAPRLTGKVWSRYSLIDYKPVTELSGNFEIRDNRLMLHSLDFGILKCSGSVGLGAPFDLDLVFNLYDVAMDDFLNFWGSGQPYQTAGTVSGDIKVSGTPDNLVLKGNLESRGGFVQKLDYDVISLNIEGIYPNMKIARSLIAKSDGVSFSFEGPLNLKDKKNFKKQLKALTIAPLVLGSGSEREWTIKRLNPDATETTELKYRMRTGDALGTGTSIDDEIDMLGIEQTRKF